MVKDLNLVHTRKYLPCYRLHICKYVFINLICINIKQNAFLLPMIIKTLCSERSMCIVVRQAI